MGRKAAIRLEGRNPVEIAASLGVQVRIDSGPNEIAGVFMRAEYDSQTRIIVIYQRSVDQTVQMLDATLPHIFELYLAHELFHHIEAHSRTSAFTRTLPPIGKMSLHRSEIAAHAFARTLTDFPALPILLDSLLLIKAGLVPVDEWERSFRQARSDVQEPARPLPSYPQYRGSRLLSSAPRE